MHKFLTRLPSSPENLRVTRIDAKKMPSQERRFLFALPVM